MSFFSPTSLIAILVAVSVHEWAHAFAAYRLGDPTAKYSGRMTLNPLAHLDPVGTILFVLVGFGWGKPVPIDPRYFKNYKRDAALTALAGPFSNLVLALAAFALGKILGIGPQVLADSGVLMAPENAPVILTFLGELLGDLVIINLILMAFNLLPIAPLDGSKIVQPWIPVRYDDLYDEFMRRGPWILLAIIVAERAFNFPFLSYWIAIITTPILGLMHAVL